VEVGLIKRRNPQSENLGMEVIAGEVLKISEEFPYSFKPLCSKLPCLLLVYWTV
jgi:hypothetical protein